MPWPSWLHLPPSSTWDWRLFFDAGSLGLAAYLAVLHWRDRFERKHVRVKLLHVLNISRDMDRFEKSIRLLNLQDGEHCTAVTVKYHGPNANAIVGVGYRMRSRDPKVMGRHTQEPSREVRDGYVEEYLIPHRANESEVIRDIVVYFRSGRHAVRRCNWRWRLKTWWWEFRVRRSVEGPSG